MPKTLELAPAQDYALVLVKPDGYRRGLSGEVIRRIERKGYQIAALKVVMADAETLAQHYHEHAHKDFFPELVNYMTSGPIVALVAAGNGVVDGVRAIIGTTMPTTAAAGTIRGDYGRDWGTGNVENIVHASDSAESARLEIGIWFPELHA